MRDAYWGPGAASLKDSLGIVAAANRLQRCMLERSRSDIVTGSSRQQMATAGLGCAVFNVAGHSRALPRALPIALAG